MQEVGFHQNQATGNQEFRNGQAASPAFGGAISIAGANASIHDSLFKGNTARGGTAVSSQSGQNAYGGAVHQGPGSTLTTHDTGGLSELDGKLATKMDALAG